MQKQFNITSVSREDLASIGIDGSALTDEQMKEIAERMAESYTLCCFWNDLESIAMDIYKLKQENI
jgi:hypothetical protein